MQDTSCSAPPCWRFCIVLVSLEPCCCSQCHWMQWLRSTSSQRWISVASACCCSLSHWVHLQHVFLVGKLFTLYNTSNLFNVYRPLVFKSAVGLVPDKGKGYSPSSTGSMWNCGAYKGFSILSVDTWEVPYGFQCHFVLINLKLFCVNNHHASVRINVLNLISISRDEKVNLLEKDLPNQDSFISGFNFYSDIF